MDVVYVNRDGENPELRYSLRTLQHVNHNRVFVFGGTPAWLNPDTVTHRKRMQLGSPYGSVRAHIKAACKDPEVSNPFMLWNDDFFAMKPVGVVPVYHRGSLTKMLDEFSDARTFWVKGLRETATLLEKRDMLTGALSYDTHLPLLVEKERMLDALRWASTARITSVHYRTLYGTLLEAEGVAHVDPKITRRNDPFPRGAWLSSGDLTFYSTVEPVLRYLFPEKSPYERE